MSKLPKCVGLGALIVMFTGTSPSYHPQEQIDASSAHVISVDLPTHVRLQIPSSPEGSLAQSSGLQLLDDMLTTTDASARKTQGLLLSEMLYERPGLIPVVVSAAHDSSYSPEARRDMARAIAHQKEGDEQRAYRGIWQQRIMASVLVYQRLLDVEGQRARLAGEMIAVASRLDLSPVTSSIHYATINIALDVASDDQVPDARSRKAPSQMMLYALATYLSHLSRQGLDINDQDVAFAQMTGGNHEAYSRGEGMDPMIYWLASKQNQPPNVSEDGDSRDLGSLIEMKLNQNRR